MSPLPGTIGLSRIRGLLGLLIHVGQILNGDGSRYTHAFLVTDDGDAFGAFPGGAVGIAMAVEERMRGPVAYLDIPLTDVQRDSVLAAAGRYLGTPYSFMEYAALIALRLRIPSRRLRAYVASSGHMICSQLVDQIYRDAGVRVFNDGRLPQDVTPGDLARLLPS